MRFNIDTLTVGFLLLTSTPAIAHPQPVSDVQATSELLSKRAEHEFADVSDLWKRKGGGGGGGRGGGSSGGKPSTGSGNSGGGSTSPSTNTGKGSPSSNAGGSTRQGSGVQPSYGGGRYYGGGSSSPYKSGLSTPGGLAPVALGVGAGVLAYSAWHYPYGAYAYPYAHPYYFRNHSRNATNSTNTKRESLWLAALVQRDDAGVNETKPIQCLCDMNTECGCEDNGNSTWLQELVGDGSYANLNKSLIDVVDNNGTSTILINGTLPDGTTVPGGTEDANSSDDGNAASSLYRASGWGVMVAIVACTVLLV